MLLVLVSIGRVNASALYFVSTLASSLLWRKVVLSRPMGAAWVSLLQWGWNFSSGVEFLLRRKWSIVGISFLIAGFSMPVCGSGLLSERELCRRLWRGAHKAVLSRSPPGRAGLPGSGAQGGVFSLWASAASHHTVPISSFKAYVLSSVCCGFFWLVCYLSCLCFPAFQTTQSRVTLLCPCPLCLLLSVTLNLEMCSLAQS